MGTRIALVWVVAALGLPAAWGDVVLLKDGTRYEGRIVAEDAATVTLEISRHGIRLKRRFDRQDIEQVTLGEEPSRAQPTASVIEKIKQADSVEELQRLGARFFRKKEPEAAAQCVVKACARDPSLLDAVVPLAPPEWKTFWHAQVLKLRETKLPAGDAAARLELAKWAHRAGLADDAQRLLARALRLDPSLTEAQELANRWRIQSGGPVRIDLRWGLGHPLMPESVGDEQQEITARSSRFRLAIIPFEYRPSEEEPPNISRTTCRFRTGSGRACRMLGIALLEGERRGWREGSGMALQMQESSEPLWERIDPMLRDGQIVLRCYNTYHPRRRTRGLERPSRRLERPSRTPSATPRGDGAYGRTGQRAYRSYSSGSGVRRTPSRYETGRSRSAGSSTPRVPPRARPSAREPSAKLPRVERPGSGYAAFVVEIPEETKLLTFQYRDGPAVSISRSLLESAHEQLDKLSDLELVEAIHDLAKFIASPSGPDALLAAAKLAAWRDSQTSAEQDEAVIEADRALLQAFAHSDPATRRQAWDAFASRESLDEATRRLIRSQTDLRVLNGMLETAQEVLQAAGKGEQEAEQAEPLGEWARRSSRRRGPELAIIPSALPESRAAAGTFALLAALLDSSQKAIVVRTVELLVADGTKQSIAVFAEASDAARAALLAKLADVSNEDLKTTAIKTLMIHPSPAMLDKLTALAAGLTFRIESEDDPLLKVAAQTQDPAVAMAVLDILSRASLQQVLATRGAIEAFSKLTGPDVSKTVRQRAIEVLADRWKSAGTSCWSRQQQRGRSQGLASVLAEAACDPAPQVHQPAAAALIRAGAVAELADKLPRADPAVRLDVVRYLATAKQLWKSQPDATMILLGTLLGDRDEKIAAAVLATIETIYKAYPAPARWRLRMGLKKDLDWAGLTRLIGSGDPKTVQRARELIAELATFEDEERRQLKLLTGQRELGEFLEKLNARRIEAPAGRYAGLVYVDLLIPPPDGNSARAAPSKRRSRSPEAQWVRASASFVIGQVSVQLVGEEPKRVRVEWSGKTLATSELSTGGRSRGRVREARRRTSAGRAQFIMNIGPPIRQALESGRLDPDIVGEKIDLNSLPEEIPVLVEHVGQGQWAGQKDLVGGAGRGDGAVGKPVFEPRSGARVAVAGIVLERMGPP